MLYREQLDTTAEVKSSTVRASVDTSFKLDTALNFVVHLILDYQNQSGTKVVCKN